MMDKSIIERDVVLIGKTEDGNDTFDLPITRLGNIEDDSEIKEKPVLGDYIPIMDMEDGRKMKKTPYVPISEQSFEFNTAANLTSLSSDEKSGTLFGKIAKAVNELITHLKDNVRHITAEERANWNGKANGTHLHSANEISGLPISLPANGGNADTVDDKHASDFAASIHNHSAASQSAAGFMSVADKKKLDGIAEGANAYTHPTYTARTGAPTTNQTPVFGGTFGISQPVSDESGHITGMNARTVKIPDTAASDSAPGLMSTNDKVKLDGIKLSGINAT